MPRTSKQKMCCAYDDPLEKAKTARVKKPKVQLTDEEKALKKLQAAEKAEERKLKKEWNDSIKPWDGSGIKFPVGTKVMFKSDAKKPYGLTEKEILSLPFNGFANSSKRIYSVEHLEKLAEKKFEALGIEYPALMFPPNFMIKTSEHLTGLLGRPDNLFARIRRNRYL